jgi:RNA polymerase sigma factor (sigma-70 family)
LSNNNSFRPLSDDELNRRSSDELIAYIRTAYDAGDRKAAQRALAILVFRHMDDVERRVAIKIPKSDVEDVAMEVMTSAIKSVFDGSSIGQFWAWLNTIIRARIADYWRTRERRPDEVPLPEEHAEAEEIWGPAAAREEAETGRVEVESIIDQCLVELNESHRAVVEHYVFEDLPGEETADRVNEDFGDQLDTPMTVQNVHKIASRFRECVRKKLEDSQG